MWMVSIAMSAAVAVVGLIFFARYRRRIAYWV
jgi:ABC-type polysaccharide/polyol phosphate export permease